MDRNTKKNLAVCIYVALALSILVVYWPVHNYGFINFDDDQYVTDNANIHGGVTAESVVWAFTTGHASNWHPLTWLSHMLDCDFYGLNPGGHHVTSVLLHVLNTLLLFAVFKRMTGALWRSAFVAAVFALHPLHVESVAWISERKDVLSTLFWLLTMAAYLDYVKRPRISRYLLAVFVFAMGLMAKPMLVTLPFVLLLLDYWPLERLRFGSSDKQTDLKNQLWVFASLIREKVPFFALSAISSIITFVVQQQGEAVVKREWLPLMDRIANALVSYPKYIEKMIWPGRLAIFYPFYKVPASHAAVAALFLLVISALVIRQRIRHRYLLVGWLWYVGTLVPVIGLVQVGAQALADRYTYVPLVGLFIMTAWGVPELLEVRLGRWRHRTVAVFASAISVILALSVCSYFQVRHWRNSELLFGHAVKVTENNCRAHFVLGVTLLSENKFDEAIKHYREVLRVWPEYPKAHNDLGFALVQKGKVEEAIWHFREALRVYPDFAGAHYNLGLALSRQGRLDEAVKHYLEALRIEPEFLDVHNDLGVLYARQGRFDQAIAQFAEALRIKPDFENARRNLSIALAQRDGSSKTDGQNTERLQK